MVATPAKEWFPGSGVLRGNKEVRECVFICVCVSVCVCALIPVLGAQEVIQVRPSSAQRVVRHHEEIPDKRVLENSAPGRKHDIISFEMSALAL